jgi:MoaA/NifB/PqqE/SkfB family radical SAM enzyme
MNDGQSLGCKACTISGGGDPLAHPQINEIINYLNDILKIDVGMVCNGVLFKNINAVALNKLKWLRVSCSSDRPLNDNYYQLLHETVTKGKNVDWAFSYVLTSDYNIDILISYIKFANEHNFTHVRIVTDLLDFENVIEMDELKKLLSDKGVDDHLVIYQGRKEFTHGRKNCYMGLLKPVIGADGWLYTCCGVQYALKEPSKANSPLFRLGRAEDIKRIMNSQKEFDGKACHRCYYDEYNTIINSLLEKTKHERFV